MDSKGFVHSVSCWLPCTQEESIITRKLRMLRKSEQLEFQMPQTQDEAICDTGLFWESKSSHNVLSKQI